MIASTISASAGHHGHSSPRGDGSDNLVACTVTASEGKGASQRQGDRTLVIAPPVRFATAMGHANGEAASVCLIPFDAAQVTHRENRSRPEPGDPATTLAATGQPMVAYHVNAAGSCAKRDHALESDHARSLDTTGGFASNQGGTLVQQQYVRRLLPVECERLQGFPDGWTALEGASDSQRYRVLGNAVAVPVVEWIARRLLKALEEGSP